MTDSPPNNNGSGRPRRFSMPSNAKIIHSHAEPPRPRSTQPPPPVQQQHDNPNDDAVTVEQAIKVVLKKMTQEYPNRFGREDLAGTETALLAANFVELWDERQQYYENKLEYSQKEIHRMIKTSSTLSTQLTQKDRKIGALGFELTQTERKVKKLCDYIDKHQPKNFLAYVAEECPSVDLEGCREPEQVLKTV
ncbi:MAG: hypothetical protein SGARI_002036, partial [Bacillariaceae sp.]